MGIYNCANTLSQAIESIINQTYGNWELIMCDDASTDNTFAIANKYFKQYPEKIVLIRNEHNSKLAYTLNRCLEYATGEYVARMDGDDISEPERLEKQVQYLKNHPDVDLVGTSMRRFDGNGMADIVFKPEYPDKFTLRMGIPFNHATILTYKHVYDTLNGYTVAERTNRAQDYDLWFRFYHHGFRGDNLLEPLYLVREDLNAIKRRTFKVRWNAFKTTRYGYKLLGYPKHWIIRPLFQMIVKSLIPAKAMLMYREYQKRREKYNIN